MNTIDTLEVELNKRVAGKNAMGNVISFVIKEEGTLCIDATSDPITISRNDADADATITISADDMMGLLDGSLNGQSLIMTGRASLKGNPMVAMKLKDFLT